ncbi:hypothetical protein OPQ81_010403 [Rhizoctonia solani]|nr:hypothetical protein OPQ81_010403 [Rhizoctonia solani]
MGDGVGATTGHTEPQDHRRGLRGAGGAMDGWHAYDICALRHIAGGDVQPEANTTRGASPGRGDAGQGRTRTAGAHHEPQPVAAGGRNFENFGEDPFLTGAMATAYIAGVQSVPGVGACMKHYVCNDAETRRFNMDQAVDERTLREVYLRPFEMVLQAGVDPWTAMTAYPKVNEQSIRATTDLEMPGPAIRYGEALRRAVEAGKVSETDHVDPCVRRLLALLDRAGLLQGPAAENGVSEEGARRQEAEKRRLEAACEGIVLLKNDSQRPLLPLDASAIKRLAVIGPNAKEPTAGGTGSAIVNPYYLTNPYDSISEAAKAQNPAVQVSYHRGIFTYLQPPLMGRCIRNSPAPDAAQGVRVDFYHGHDFSGDIVATTYWHDSRVYLMSDGDTPRRASGPGLLLSGHGRRPACLSRASTTSAFPQPAMPSFLSMGIWWWTTQTGPRSAATLMNCGSAEVFAKRHLVAGQAYALHVDNIAVPPPTPPHDNTLFHKISGVRVGLLLRHDEEALFLPRLSRLPGLRTSLSWWWAITMTQSARAPTVPRSACRGGPTTWWPL